MAYLLVRVGNWNYPHCEGQYVILAVVVFYELWCLVFITEMLRIVISSWWTFPLINLYYFFLIFWISFPLKSILLATLACFLESICLEYLLTFYLELMSVFDVKVYFLDAAKGMVLVFLSSLFICAFIGWIEAIDVELLMNSVCWLLLFCCDVGWSPPNPTPQTPRCSEIQSLCFLQCG